MNASVLVVDDEPTFRLLAEEALTAEGFDVRTASRLSEAKALAEASTPDVLILDRRLPDGDGLDVLRGLRPDGTRTTVAIVVTAYGDVESAVEALKAGAADYLTKPIQLTDLVVKLRKVLEARGLRDQLALARTQAFGPPTVDPSSASMRAVVQKLRSVSTSRLTPVFLRGPSGVGKQRAAEMLHHFTYDAHNLEAPFVDVNCAALPDDLVESELFGHEKGAFTDARTARRGLIEMAGGGTLFLDEVAELPLRSQAKLLKFLDSMRFRRLGGQREIAVELRIVAATNQDVEALVLNGRLRDDLYHRLAVFVVEIPPLRERQEDIPALARSFLAFSSERVKKRRLELSRGALEALMAYAYPGNVRELRNIIERAVILARGPEITESDVMLSHDAAPVRPAVAGFYSVSLGSDGAPPPLADVERGYVARVLQHCDGHRTAAAVALGISYPTFLKRLREMGLD
ncbi:MAG: sigma-54 dependent transcriptional regulator [Vicinamibacterales bacterium]